MLSTPKLVDTRWPTYQWKWISYFSKLYTECADDDDGDFFIFLGLLSRVFVSFCNLLTLDAIPIPEEPLCNDVEIYEAVCLTELLRQAKLNLYICALWRLRNYRNTISCRFFHWSGYNSFRVPLPSTYCRYIEYIQSLEQTFLIILFAKFSFLKVLTFLTWYSYSPLWNILTDLKVSLFENWLSLNVSSKSSCCASSQYFHKS